MGPDKPPGARLTAAVPTAGRSWLWQGPRHRLPAPGPGRDTSGKGAGIGKAWGPRDAEEAIAGRESGRGGQAIMDKKEKPNSEQNGHR